MRDEVLGARDQGSGFNHKEREGSLRSIPSCSFVLRGFKPSCNFVSFVDQAAQSQIPKTMCYDASTIESSGWRVYECRIN